MAKQGMKRPDRTHTKPKNDVPPVPEIQGKAKHGKNANPIIEGTKAPAQKVYHTKPHSRDKSKFSESSVVDTDLARDNIQNDMPEAELQDL